MRLSWGAANLARSLLGVLRAVANGHYARSHSGALLRPAWRDSRTGLERSHRLALAVSERSGARRTVSQEGGVKARNERPGGSSHQDHSFQSGPSDPWSLARLLTGYGE